MNRYESYKEASLPWLKEVPSHWEVKNVNSIFDERREKVSDKDYQALSVTKKGIYKQLDNVAKTNNGDNRKKVLINDFVINSRSDRKGSSGLSSYEGSVSLINTVLSIKKGVPNFLNYLLKSIPFQEEFYRNGKGIVADLWSTNFQSMKNIALPLPPIQEQTQIANYLDWKINEIDKLIAIEKEKIKELERTKKSIITKIVREGVWKNKEKIVQNIDWIYETPKDWKIIKLKFLGKAKNGLTYEPKDLSDDGMIVLRSSNIQNEKLDLKDIVYLKSKIPSNMFLKKDDILICSRNGSRNLVGKNILIEEDDRYTFGAFMCRFRSKYNKYLYWVFNSEMFDYYMKLFTTSTINQLTNSNLYSMYVPLPSEEEQEKIIKYLSKKRKQLNELINKINQQLQNLESLKQSLISEVVTGQIDVRDVVIPEYEKLNLENDAELEEEVEEDA